MDKCWSCQAYLGNDNENEDGLYCPNCHDDASSADLEMNGYEFDGNEWVRND